MTVSIIIPAYNAAAFLGQSVPAVLQLDAALEWIWVDDGSTDDTLDLLHTLTNQHERVRLLQHATNLGRAAARNRAIEEAQGDILAFLDADARPRVGYIDAHLAALEDPGAVASVGHVVPADPDPADPYSAYLRTHARGPRATRGATSWKHFISGAACVRANALRDVGGFNADIAYGEDSELACRLAARHPEGLQAAPRAVIDLFGTETLSGVLSKARQFGTALPKICTSCPNALTILELNGLKSPAVRAMLKAPALATLVHWIVAKGPAALAAPGVRYLLAHALYQGYTDA